MSSDNKYSNKTIAKNTLFLYSRMFLTIIVGLFTSRVVLQVLGVSDYGVYNVVGGVASILAFLNSGMVSASQRFLAFEIGRGDKKRLKNVFCTSVTTHAAIALIIFLVSETIGLWFVNAKLNIDPERMASANWVYQCSILTFMVSVLSVPYNSCIVAHERMNVYAYVSIYSVVMKLIVAYSLYVSPWDKLILYSTLLLIVQVTERSIYTIFCKRHFDECTFKFNFDQKLFKEMFSFAGWSIVGNIGLSFREQGSNIILNLFYGTTLNAARGIAIQVSTYVNSFANNFAIAFTPQITKQYAAGNIDKSMSLVYVGARYAFFLMSLVAFPLILNIDAVLELWLGIVPEYTSTFIILTLTSSLMYCQTQTITCAIQATGNVKWFQILLSALMLSEIPIVYVAFAMGGKPYMAMLPNVVTSFMALYLRFIILKRMMPKYELRKYTIEVIFRCWAVFLIGVAISIFAKLSIENTQLSLIINVLVSFIINLILIAILGINKSERAVVLNKLHNMIKR